MRILWVKAGGIVPADTGGRLRSLKILKELARRNSVTLFTYYADHEGDQHSELEEFADVVAIPIALAPRRRLRDYSRFAHAICSSQPFSLQVIGGESGGRLRSFDLHAIRRQLTLLMARKDFDVAICDFIFPAGVIDWRTEIPKVLFTHNVEADLWKQQYEAASNPVKKLVYAREWRALEAAELHYASLADSVITVSEKNRAYFASHIAPARVTNIATGVDVNYFQPRALPSPEPSITFTGSMDWMPNQDGVRFFTSEILPRVHTEVPHADVWIVGRCPGRDVQALADSRVHVTGRVQDVRPYLERSPVYIVPLRFGSGTRIKIFEAMAMGRAVVSTTLGAEGLPVKHGENILIADRPDQFADTVVHLLKNPEYASKIGRAGRALVERQFSWAAVAEQFSSILQGVALEAVPLKSKTA